MSTRPTTIVSAPGKVLLAGGYLVLDRQHQGLVIGANARFYSLVQSRSATPLASEAVAGLPSGFSVPIRIRSPQFLGASWSYELSCASATRQCTLRSQDTKRNPFVEIVLYYTFNLASHYLNDAALCPLLGQGFDITILGDNDFYSQRQSLAERGLLATTEALRQLPAFNPTGTTLGAVHKTGLGSSAALVTSLVCALLLHFGLDKQGPVKATKQPLRSPEFLTWVHNVAQFCHCLAQGKIGSGFDVSAAVYGSHVYQRFSPTVLEPIMPANANVLDAPAVDSVALMHILAPTATAWDNLVSPIALPPGFTMMLADVDAGSHTPSMVSKVLAWRKTNPTEAQRIWNALGGLNQTLVGLFNCLQQLASEDATSYRVAIAQCAGFPAAQWKMQATTATAKVQSIITAIANVTQTFEKIRAHLRAVGEHADVPIEPPQQTALLDCCMDLPGVVMAGVPGGEQASVAVETLWCNWQGLAVSPLLVHESSQGLQCYADTDPQFAPYVEPSNCAF
ncbi:phosphomevalonate kinase [Dimargaris verticillata]|uniref:Phosphomevalonate kinase n=1 Tax=Dimargaris verticillata TaxID=2761393 RepID=A0A9W8B0I3_9FUNG|nr:phosphomevalonate kinase [Dimargaris verticillata]